MGFRKSKIAHFKVKLCCMFIDEIEADIMTPNFERLLISEDGGMKGI